MPALDVTAVSSATTCSVALRFERVTCKVILLGGRERGFETPILPAQSDISGPLGPQSPGRYRMIRA